MTRELLVTRLELGGFHAVTARDGREALRNVREMHPEAMVLDINMPELDGFEVLASLKSRGELEHLPVLVLTARHTTADVQTAIRLGARDYLAKPVDPAVFLNRVRRLLRKAPQAPGPPPSAPPDVLEV